MQIEQVLVYVHEVDKQELHIDLSLNSPRKLLEQVEVSLGGDRLVSVVEPSVLQIALHFGFELRWKSIVTIVFLHGPQEDVESLSLFVILIQVLQFFDHRAEVVHQHRRNHYPEQHEERAQDPLAVALWMEVT